MRIGAVVDCPACGSRFRVDRSHVGRRAPVALSPLSMTIPSELPSLPGREATANSDSSVVGLSGLSELMRQQQGGGEAGGVGGAVESGGSGSVIKPAGAVKAPVPTPGARATPASAPSGVSDPRLPKRKGGGSPGGKASAGSRRLEVIRRRGKAAAQRRRRRTLYAVLATACGLIAVVGLMIYVMSRPTPAPEATNAATGGPTAEGAGDEAGGVTRGSDDAVVVPEAEEPVTDDGSVPGPARNPFRRGTASGEPAGGSAESDAAGPTEP
ncbi:MAG: hypothetical protein AAF750_03960 [Planctomycetota bacterium]